MYLSELKVWNFRKFGHADQTLDLAKPDLKVQFQNGLNVLIGSNDSGKTAIIDAIKLVCKTHAAEWIKMTSDDFFQEKEFYANRMRIECIMRGLKDEEAAHFTEWLGMESDRKEPARHSPFLRLILDVTRDGDRILPFEINAGTDDEGNRLSATARDYLKTTYLMPLRDAKSELVPKRNSRLSQVLEGHEYFKDKDDHYLKRIAKCFNCLTQKYFNPVYKDPGCNSATCDLETKFEKDVVTGATIRETLNQSIAKFLGGDQQKTDFSVLEPKLKSILEGLKLSLGNELSGLGMHNILFIATELLNLNRENWTGIRMALIEELEAHLEPQAQMRVIEYFHAFIEKAKKDKSEDGKDQKPQDVQFILTTHSPNIGSKVRLQNILLCNNNRVFPMGEGHTKLAPDDYTFLERFLDVTKANLFFAKGIIFVEGWAEELLLPSIAKKIDINLTEKGISIVNVGSTAFLRYSKIFQRNNPEDGEMDIPVAIITDLDIKPDEYVTKPCKTEKDYIVSDKIETKKNKYRAQNIEAFVSPHWTLEYCIASSSKLQPQLIAAIKKAATEQEITIVEDEFKTITPVHIYQDIILGYKISKTILAQHLAQLLEKDTTITRDDLKTDVNIKYLVDAIQYVAK
ncbi:MAG: AAA family ATPase [Elusimicrobiota bacterium]